MKTQNKVLMREAREVLNGKWIEGVKVTLLYFLISILVRFIPKIGWLVSLVIAGPFIVGLYGFWLSFSRNQNPRIARIFDEFKKWWRGFFAYFLILIYTFLWTLLFIIPGVIASFSYSMTYYILAEDHTIKINDAINKSKKIMKGNKWKLFFLELRFLGWLLLCIPTLGIGLLWLIPYINVTTAKFYDDIKEQNVPTPNIPQSVPVPVA
ncbi:MAG: DUF975 family protein [Patescibacteria group bacterium]|nr:DUF975 family protein [Patescibacteria group bacterium]